MDISQEQTNLINHLIERFIVSSAADPNNLRQLAESERVLPLLLDSGGVFTINAVGDVVSYSWENRKDPRIESDLRVRNVALFQGSKTYPDLRSLIQKPQDARVCPSCGGTGIDPYAKKLNTDAIICYCGGLGWIP